MDVNDKFIVLFVVCVVVCMGYSIGMVYAMSHDENILESHRRDAELQHFIESNNLNNQGKYDLAKSICKETFSNKSLWEKLYRPKIPFWDIEGHKEHEINRCECALLGID